MHLENIIFQYFWELGGGPLGKTLGCHPNFDVFCYLKAAASAADLSGLAIWSKSGHIDSFSAGQLAGPGAGLAELAGSTGSANFAGPAWE